MAFPVVASVTETVISTRADPWSVNMPASVNSGSLILVFLSAEDPAQSFSASGYTSQFSEAEGGVLLAGCIAKVASGSEGGSPLSVALGGSSNESYGTAQVWVITGWGGNLATDVDLSTPDSGAGSGVGFNIVTAGGGSADNLFIATASHADDDEAVTAWPASYADNQTETRNGLANNLNANLAVASRNLAAASDTPGNFSLSGSESSVGVVFVIAPGSSGNGGAPSSSASPLINGGLIGSGRVR